MSAPDRLIPPLAFVIPWVVTAPHGLAVHIDPPVHVVSPLIVTVSTPVSVPPLSASTATGIVFGGPLGVVEKFNTPALTVNVPTLVTVPGEMKFVVPLPLFAVAPVTL